jgi:pimeloyl-[acyl-carrier protein] methyl ester esterase
MNGAYVGGHSLVVVGGWGVDARMLQPVVAQWSGDVHFVSLDDRLLDACQTLTDVAQALVRQYPEPATWLGWSQGSQVVMAAASLKASPVKNVVTLAGFPRFVSGDGWSAGMAPETFDAFRKGLSTDPQRSWRRFQQLLVHGGPREMSGQARHALGPWINAGPVAAAENLERGLTWLAREDQRPLWQQLEVPALHLLAAGDALVRPWLTELPLPECADARVISGMSHWPTGENAHECRRAVHDFAAAVEEVT